MIRTTVERAIATFAVDDDDWALIAPFMPTKTRNSGSETNWRAIVDALIVKWMFRNCAWRKFPSASRVRMAWHRSIEFGTWSAIERALPTLNLSRSETFRRICFAAHQAKGARR